MKSARLFTALVLAAACAKPDTHAADSARAADSVASAAKAADTAQATLDGSVSGFKTPESVKYDETADMYFVSNINGNPSNKDGNGFISRVKPDGTVDSMMFIAGGTKGVTLNAPKGMAIVGDTLWVADIDAVRAFNRNTGAPIASVELGKTGATFLNDVAVGADGAIYITDTGIKFAADGSMSHPGKNRIYRVQGRTAKIVAEGDALGNPNGITWDGNRGAFVLAPFGGNAVQSWSVADTTPRSIATGPGSYDGVEAIASDRLLVSSWADSAVHEIRAGQMRTVVSGKAAPADFGWDSKRRRILVPLFNDNRVEFWRLP